MIFTEAASGSGWVEDEWETADEGHDYWISYADLLAGLLMVFALLLLTALFYYQGQVTRVRDLLETRREIVRQIQERLEGAEGVNVVVDSVTGSVNLGSEVLFNEDEAQLLPQGERQLRAFAEEYLGILLGTDRYQEHLRAIVIEGHTNDNGPYMYNLDLSQRRAFSVMAFLLENSPRYQQALREFVTANGRSFSDPIYEEDNPAVVDDVRSRRIEIRFRLNDREVIQEIMERLFLS